MNDKRFDAFSRTTTALLSRRAIAGLSLFGVLSIASGRDAAGKHRKHKKKHHRCVGPKVKYFCRSWSGKRCRFVPKPDGSSCPDGQCFDGDCFAPPVCVSPGGICDLDEHCCSGNCDAHVCQLGEAGTLCTVDDDCASGTCVGFHCA